MIDYFAIALTHGLIALAAWRLFLNDELDADPAAVAAQEAGREGGDDA
jgi:hypothetical protein